MNERIEKLFEQALDHAVPETWTTLTHGQLLMVKDKFAELIVKECIDTAFHRGHPDLEFLLKHFGVEESGINQQLRNRSTYFGNNP